MKPSFSTQALVLKRVDAGEVDRILTIFTPDQGKLTCVAKGVRRMSSTQRAYLEPGNHVTVFVTQTRGLPLITQTRLISDFASNKKDLQSIKKLAQVLEIIDRLFPEGVEEQELFLQAVSIIGQLEKPETTFLSIQAQLSEVLVQLGYLPFGETQYTSIMDYASAVAERPLHSYDYLTVRKSEI